MKLSEKCIKCAKHIPWVCFYGNLCLAIFKVTIAFITGSKGLLADGLHSGSDVLATAMVLVSLKIADKEPDAAHPWGYGKVEYIGSFLVYTILLFLGGYIFIDAAIDIITGKNATPHMISLFAAGVSITANVILSSYGFCAGKRLNSPAMIANANENKADMLSSIAVAFGIIGASMGFGFADPLAAILVALLIIRMSAHLLIEAIAGLMDKSIDKKAVAYIRKIALSRKAVSGVSYIKARKLGGQAWVELEIFINSNYTVAQANNICSEVRTAIMRQALHIKEVVVAFTSDGSKFHKNNNTLSSVSNSPKKKLFNFAFKRNKQTV